MATKETPFSMVYGAEIVLPMEIDIETAQVLAYTPTNNETIRVEELDLMEER